MCEEMKDWKPMTEDFNCLTFNSYSRGQTAAQLPNPLLPAFANCGQRRADSQHNFKLFIDGFPSDLTQTGLKNFLMRIGSKPLSVKILQSSTRLGKPFSFVEFESRRAAQKAIELIRNQKIYKLFVCFTSTETVHRRERELIGKEFEDFAEQIIKQNNELRETSLDLSGLSIESSAKSRPSLE